MPPMSRVQVSVVWSGAVVVMAGFLGSERVMLPTIGWSAVWPLSNRCVGRVRSGSAVEEGRAGADRGDDLGDGSDRLVCGSGVFEQADVGGVHDAVDMVGGQVGVLLAPTLPVSTFSEAVRTASRPVIERGGACAWAKTRG